MTVIGEIFDATATPALMHMMGEMVILYPSGVSANGTPVEAMVTRAAIEGRNQAPGDGPLIEEREGRIIRETIIVTVSQDADVDDTRSPPDLFRVFSANKWQLEYELYQTNSDEAVGQIYGVKRKRAADGGLVDVECVRKTPVTYRRQRMVG